ncbi:MAG: DnaB-like helicase C-terminal domain-containing protein [Gemmatimonadota bacterium]
MPPAKTRGPAPQGGVVLPEASPPTNASHLISDRKEVFYETMVQLERLVSNPEHAGFIRTGLHDVDSLITGFSAGDLVVVGGRPAMGKTSFGLGLTVRAALDQATPTVFFSQESSAEALMTRVIAAEAHVNQTCVRTGRLHTDDFMRMGRAAGLLSQAPLWFESLSNATLASLRERISALVQNAGVRLVVIDYLQLFETLGAESRHQGVAAISRGLKNLAREYKISIIILSQCSRAPEQRSGFDKRPQLPDLRDSGAIEDDADIVMFLYRREYYDVLDGRDPNEPNRWGEISAGRAEVIIAKQRNGPTGTAFVAFDRSYSRFDNLPTSS